MKGYVRCGGKCRAALPVHPHVAIIFQKLTNCLYRGKRFPVFIGQGCVEFTFNFVCKGEIIKTGAAQLQEEVGGYAYFFGGFSKHGSNHCLNVRFQTGKNFFRKLAFRCQQSELALRIAFCYLLPADLEVVAFQQWIAGYGDFLYLAFQLTSLDCLRCGSVYSVIIVRRETAFC